MGHSPTTIGRLQPAVISLEDAERSLLDAEAQFNYAEEWVRRVNDSLDNLIARKNERQGNLNQARFLQIEGVRIPGGRIEQLEQDLKLLDQGVQDFRALDESMRLELKSARNQSDEITEVVHRVQNELKLAYADCDKAHQAGKPIEAESVTRDIMVKAKSVQEQAMGLQKRVGESVGCARQAVDSLSRLLPPHE